MIQELAKKQTPWNRIHFERVVFIKLVKECPSFYKLGIFLLCSLMNQLILIHVSYWPISWSWPPLTEVLKQQCLWGKVNAQLPNLEDQDFIPGFTPPGTCSIWLLHWGVFNLGDPADSYTIIGTALGFLQSLSPLCLSLCGPLGRHVSLLPGVCLKLLNQFQCLIS